MGRYTKAEQQLENVSDIMTEQVEQNIDPNGQKQAYEEYLELDEHSASELAEVEQDNVSSEEFDSIPDEELEVLYEKALDAEDGERTEKQNALLEQTKERYLKIKFYRQFADAAEWFEMEYPDKDYIEIVSSMDFIDFASGVKLPVRELIRRFINMEEKGRKYIGPGSVKTNGQTVEKDYFSPAEVDRMSESEITKNLEIIKKSMRKWK